MLVGVLGGLIAAVLWGTSAVAAAGSSRRIHPRSAIVWVYAVGCLTVTPIAIWRGVGTLTGRAVAWEASAALSAVASIYLMYAALRCGPVSLVMPIEALQGGLAAILAFSLGERLEPIALLGIILMFSGTWCVIRRQRGPANEIASRPTAALTLALCSSLTGAIALVAMAQAGKLIGTAAAIAGVRWFGVAGLGLPLLLTRRLELPRRVGHYVAFSGVADTTAFAAYLIAAAKAGIALPAVVSSQWAAVSVFVGLAFLRERLTLLQLAGTVAIFAGIGIVAAAQP